MSTPKHATAITAATSDRSMWRQGADGSRRVVPGPMGCRAVAVTGPTPSGARERPRAKRVRAKSILRPSERDRTQGLPGQAVEDASSDGCGRLAAEAGFLHHHGDRVLG